MLVRRGSLVLALFFFLACALGACDSASGEVREWRPTDHDPPESVGNAAGQVTARPAGDTSPDDPSLVELAWQSKCATCHGRRGAGDGPQGPMVRAPDLTRADWQAKVSDPEIADTIRKGRNKMPAFDLPDGVVQGLVKRIRAAGKAAAAPPPSR